MPPNCWVKEENLVKFLCPNCMAPGAGLGVSGNETFTCPTPNYLAWQLAQSSLGFQARDPKTEATFKNSNFLK